MIFLNLGLFVKRNLLKKPDRHPPKPGAGYAPGKHLFSLVLMQNGGGGSLEDLRQIRKGTGLRELLRRDMEALFSGIRHRSRLLAEGY